MQDPVPDVGDHHRRQHHRIEEHRPPEAPPGDGAVHHQRGHQRDGADHRDLHRHEPERVPHSGPEVVARVPAGLGLQPVLAGEDVGIVRAAHEGPVEERDRRAPGEADIEVQDHRQEGEEAEDQHVGQEKRIGHPAPAPDRLRGLHRRAEEVHREARHLRQPVAAGGQKPRPAAQHPEGEDRQRQRAGGRHAPAARTGAARGLIAPPTRPPGSSPAPRPASAPRSSRRRGTARSR